MKYYVVCHPLITFREEAMRRRCRTMGILDDTTMIPGGNYQDPLCAWYAISTEPKKLKEAGCLLGHLRALRAFVNDNVPYGCVLEDDVLFRHDFVAKVDELIRIHASEPLIQLSVVGYKYAGRCRLGIWGTQGYILKREYAIACLSQYDRPMRYYPPNTSLTSECITMHSNGIAIGDDPIIIEDRMSVSIEDDSAPFQVLYTDSSNHAIEASTTGHLANACEFGYHNFIGSDPEYRIPSRMFMGFAHLLSTKAPQEIYDVLLRITEPENSEHEIVLCLFYMLAGWYVAKDVATIKSHRFFELISTGAYPHVIRTWHRLATSVARFYSPAHPILVTQSEKDAATLESHSNWMCVPNACQIK